MNTNEECRTPLPFSAAKAAEMDDQIAVAALELLLHELMKHTPEDTWQVLSGHALGRCQLHMTV